MRVVTSTPICPPGKAQAPTAGSWKAPFGRGLRHRGVAVNHGFHVSTQVRGCCSRQNIRGAKLSTGCLARARRASVRHPKKLLPPSPQGKGVRGIGPSPGKRLRPGSWKSGTGGTPNLCRRPTWIFAIRPRTSSPGDSCGPAPGWPFISAGGRQPLPAG